MLNGIAESAVPAREFGDVQVSKTPREIKNAEIQKDLLYIEEQEVFNYCIWFLAKF